MTTRSTPAYESRIFTEGTTLAERRALRAARGEHVGPGPRPPRLVSLGAGTITLEPFGTRPGRPQRVEVETFVDIDRMADMYRRILPNGTIERMVRYPEVSDEVIERIDIPAQYRSQTPLQIAAGPAAPDQIHPIT